MFSGFDVGQKIRHNWLMAFYTRFYRLTGMMVSMVFLLSACGVKGKLVRPTDIPAYEKREEQHGSFPL